MAGIDEERLPARDDVLIKNKPEAIPIRLKQVHIINTSAYIGKLFAVCKPFLNADVAKLFHEPNSDTLYQDVPLELLPQEYGGSAGTIDQIKRYWIKRIEAKRYLQ